MAPTLPAAGFRAQPAGTPDWRGAGAPSVCCAAMTPSELVATACPTINALGSAFYFTPATLARGKELGLRGMQYYIVGRGGVLGDAEPSVIRSAFGYFKPSVIADAWTSGAAVMTPRAAGRAYFESCASHGRTTLAGVAGLDAFAAAAGAVNDAADDAGLALYAGIKSEPLADDVAARAFQLITVLREFRGSAHLIALRSVGITDHVAHFIKRPDAVKTFGWSDDDVPEITPELTDLMTAAEALTDRIVTPAYAVLDHAQQTALVDGLAAIKVAHAPA